MATEEHTRSGIQGRTHQGDLPLCAVSDHETTVDDFLGGQVRLTQPRSGYRVSMDTVMLAAAVPARSGDRVIEGGLGSAGAAICLATRVPGVTVVGVEKQADMRAAASHNIAANGLQGRITVVEGDVAAPSGLAGTFDHALINPPYLEHGRAIRPPVDNKGYAHMNEGARLKDWITFCLFHVRHKGTVTVVYRADRLDELMALMHRRIGDLMICPLWPRVGTPAKRVIVQGRKGTRGRAFMLPGLALHGETERYTSAARRILWDGEALDLRAWKGPDRKR